MKYIQPVKRTSEEILDTLRNQNTTPSDRIDAVLSAIFYGESLEFSGDILIKEFSDAKYKEKVQLKNIFETFYQINETTYRIDESISLLSKYKQEEKNNASYIDNTIDTLIEYKEIFGGL